MSPTVKVGDRFRRPGKFLDVYRVVALQAFDRRLVLAELVSEARRAETLSIPATTLLNPSQWRPVV
jgi:hypothetical protein